MEQMELFTKSESSVEKLLKNSPLFLNAHRLFFKQLNIQLHYYIDTDLSIAFGKPILDIEKFDNWLHEKYGNYEEKGMSMQGVLIENYGHSVMEDIKRLLI